MKQVLSEVAQYLLLEGEADDGRHAPVAGWMWWAANPNSVDTGGLVSSPGYSIWFQQPYDVMHLLSHESGKFGMRLASAMLASNQGAEKLDRGFGL